MCIRTAIAIKAGVVKEVKGDDEKGKCHALYVDVQTNQVVKAK